MGPVLVHSGPPPELVLCSSAARTLQTLQLLDLGLGTEILVETRLYGATAGELLARLKMVPASVGSVLLIGHNPGIEQLTRMLDDEGLASVEKFPTAGLAVLHLPIDTWNELTPRIGHVDRFVSPRDLS
jgi:phosphohistidine phosphatase